MRKSPRPLGSGFEPLEDRSLPTTFGIPWADPGHLTLSFVPNGTPTPLGPSTLQRTLGAATPTATWQREVLRAFQTWAANTNINITVVPDGGQPLGTPGAVHGDNRFGDIRIAAAPLSDGVVASASPFSWTGTTYSGDVVFNSNDLFRVGNVAGAYDIYSATIHEAGHVFGLDHTDAPGSVMNEDYQSHTGLSTGDVAAIRAMYGVRAPDAADAAGGNDTTARATSLKATGLLGRFAADGDLTTTADVDYYRFSTLPSVALTSNVIHFQVAGLSLVTPRVTVYNSAGKVVASAVSTDPLHNDLTVQFTNPLLGGTFYVKVEGASEDVFGIGGYRLTVDTINLNIPVPLLSSLLTPVTDLLNNTLDAATDLTSPSPTKPDARFDATARGAIGSSSDTDYYKVRAPLASGTAPMALNVMVWGTGGNPLDPRARVYDANGNPVAFRVLANETGLFSVEVDNATPGTTHYLQVSARTPGGANGTGTYFLGADFNQFAPTAYDALGGDTLDTKTTTRTATLNVSDAGIFQFALAAQGASGGVTMTVLDASGRVVFTLDATAGQPMTTAVQYLAAGSYTVRYTYRGSSPAPSSPVRYDLFLLKLSDGIGPYASRTTTAAPGDSTSSSTSPPPPSGSPDTSGSPPATYSDSSPGYTYDSSSGTTTSGSYYYF